MALVVLHPHAFRPRPEVDPGLSTVVEILALHLYSCPSLCVPVEDRTVLIRKTRELLDALEARHAS